MGKELLQEAMRSLSITELWKKRGWLGQPGKSCNFPNDTDRKKAACSIFPATTGRRTGLELLKDHKMAQTYDAPGLLAVVESLPLKDASRLFISLAGLSVKPLDHSGGKRSKTPQVPKSPAPSREESAKPPPFDFSVLEPRELDADEVEAIATTRGVSVRTVESLMKWGVVHGVTLTAALKLPIPRQSLPMAAWALHTPEFASFRLRAFCGQFPGFDGRTSKSLTPAGASCSSPVFIGPKNAERVLIVEGEMDALAAFEIARRERKQTEGLAVVVIFSASITIPSAFLPRLQGRRVRIVPHCCDSKNQGTIAAVKWAATVKPWAASVEIFNLSGLAMPDGRPVTDLGDLARCTDEVLNSLKGLTTW